MLTHHCSVCGEQYPDGNNICHPAAIVETVVSPDTLDGIPQIATTPQDLDLNAAAASQALRRALHVYDRASSRPRKAQCWAYVQCELWNARQDALRTGALVRGSEPHRFVSDRYSDASNKLETARRMERAGHADARV